MNRNTLLLKPQHVHESPKQGCWERGAGAGSAYFQKSPEAGVFFI
jgi:hypothetical protein